MAGPNISSRKAAQSERVQEAQAELRAALTKDDPSCLNDDRFTASRPAPLRGEEKKQLYLICFECPVFEACAEYAAAMKPTAGFWAGKNYGTWERKP